MSIELCTICLEPLIKNGNGDDGDGNIDCNRNCNGKNDIDIDLFFCSSKTRMEVR